MLHATVLSVRLAIPSSPSLLMAQLVLSVYLVLSRMIQLTYVQVVDTTAKRASQPISAKHVLLDIVPIVMESV